MKRYTLAFIFTPSFEQVLLVHKLSPEWQKGMLNGIGGKVEPGEASIDCISREVKEEANLLIKKEDWLYLGELKSSGWHMDVYTTVYTGSLSDAKKTDKEEIEWISVGSLPENTIGNLTWLIPFSLDKIQDPQLDTFSIVYKENV